MWQRTWELAVASSLHIGHMSPAWPWGPSGDGDLGRTHGLQGQQAATPGIDCVAKLVHQAEG